MATGAVQTAIYQLGLDPSAWEQASARVARASEQMAAGAENLTVQEEKVDRATRATAAGFDRLLGRLDPAIRAQQQYERTLAQVARYEAAGIGTASERANAVARATSQYEAQIVRLNQLRVANETTGESFDAVTGRGRYGGRGALRSQQAIRQVGFQVQDLAIQLQSGQNAFMAFSQQGGQMAQALLGPQAALIATITLIGAMLAKTFLFGESVEETESSLHKYEKAVKAAGDANKAFNKALEDQNELLLTNEERQRVATASKVDDQVKFFEGQAEAARKRVEQINLALGIQGRDPGRGARPVAGPGFGDFSELDQKLLEERENLLRKIIDAEGELTRIRDPEQRGDYRERAENLKELLENAAREVELARMSNEEREIALALDKARKEFGEQFTAQKEKEYVILLRQKQAAERVAEAEEKAADAAEKAALDAFKHVDKEREAAAKREVTLEKYIAALEAVAETEGLSTVEKEVQRALIEAQNKLLDEQGQKLRDLTEEERRRVEEAVRTKVEIEEQRAAREKAVKEQQRAIERTTDDIVRYAGDTFGDLFTDTKFSWSEMWEDMKLTAIRTLARIAAEAALRPIITPIVGAFMGGGAAGSILGPGMGAGFSPTAQPGYGGGWIDPRGGGGLGSLGGVGSGLLTGFSSPALGRMVADAALNMGLGTTAAGRGFFFSGGANLGYGALGGLAAGLLGLGSGNMLVDTGLGTAGAFIGGAFGGPIGAALGGFAGTAAGGLFGGGGGFRNGPLTEGFTRIRNGRLEVSGVGTKGGDLAAGREWAESGVGFINALLDSGALSDISGRPRFDIKFGQLRTFVGPTPRNAAAPRGGFLGRGTDAEAVLIDTVQNMVKRGFADVDSPEVRLAIKKSAAKTIEDFVSDLDFAAALSSIDLNPEPLTQYQRAVEDITEAFTAAATRARSLGISAQSLNDARDKALTDLNEGVRRSIEDQILAFTDPMALALRELERAQESRLKEAVAAGVEMVKIEELNALERQKIVEEFGRAANDNLQKMLDELTSGAASPLAPAETLANAQARFNELRAAALGGDTAARTDIAGAADNLLKALEASFGRSPKFFEGYTLITATLRDLLDVPGFARGTLSAPPGLALVGEQGPELVRFRGGEQVIPNFGVANDNLAPVMQTVGRDLVAAIYRATDASLDGSTNIVRELRALRAATAEMRAELRELKSAQRTAQAPMRRIA